MSNVRSAREAAGLTQTELAQRAGVSRQLVGSLESGRHLPRVDAAIALAHALDVDVVHLFGRLPSPVDVVTGASPEDGSVVRIGRVGDRVVTAAARSGLDGFDVADAVIRDGAVDALDESAPGFVVAGCEPGLGLLERLLREGGMRAVSAPSSSAAAMRALVDGRAHAAVVHGADSTFPRLPASVALERYRLCAWQVGLSAPADANGTWWAPVLEGRAPVVQRESGAGVQRAFEAAVGSGGVAGPRVGTHMDAAWRSVVAGMAAVTIEPAALAVGARFHALETHRAELWCRTEWVRSRPVTAALDTVAGARFQRRLSSVGGYDLAGCGGRLA